MKGEESDGYLQQRRIRLQGRRHGGAYPRRDWHRPRERHPQRKRPRRPFGNSNPASSAVYQLSSKDNEIALLKAQQYADNKVAALTERVSNLEARVYADEKTDPLRDQLLGERISGLTAIVNRIAVPMVPNYAVAPGWGPAMVAPLPPPFHPAAASGGSTVTPASTSGTTAQAA